MINLSEIRNNLLMRTRLKVMVILLILLITILCVVSINGVRKMNEKAKEINNSYLINIQNFTSLKEKLFSIIVENHISGPVSQNNDFIHRLRETDTEEIQKYIDEYDETLIPAVQNEVYSSFIAELQNYLSVTNEKSYFKANKEDSVIQEVISTKEITSFRYLQDLGKQVILINAKEIEKNLTIYQEIKANTIINIILVCFLILIISILTSYFLIKDIPFSIDNLKKNLFLLGSGSIPDVRMEENANEIGQLAKISNTLSDNLFKLREFANEIGKGNYFADYKLSGDEDVLGKSLIFLRDNLKQTKNDEDKRKLEDERRNWASKGMALIGDILRQYGGNINELADHTIKNIIIYLNANQGGLFIYNDNNKEDVYLELLAAFAYDRKKYLTKRIAIGEGLLGMCALEKNTVYLKDIPGDYMEIESGLGEAAPKCLLIVPLKTDETILGVIEIASFNELKKHEIEFVENLSDSIASTLSTARINARTAQLLGESQSKSQELAQREEEMRQNMEEMRFTQEEALRSKAEMSGILAAVDQTLLKSEYETDGFLISANLRYLSTLGYHLSELQGKNIRNFIPPEHYRDFEKIWETLLSGQPHKTILYQKHKNGKIVWLLSQYTPVVNESGRVIKILHLASDITEQKLIEEEAKRQSLVLIEQEKERSINMDALKASQLEIAQKNKEISEKVYFYEQLLDAVSFPISVTDLDNLWTFFNKPFGQIVQSKREELIGLAANTNSVTEQPDKVFKVDKFSIFDTSYNKIGFVELFQDVTQQKKAEDNNLKLLEESREKAKQLEAQDEEMRQNIEELISTQEYMAKNETELRGIQAAIDFKLMKIEVSPDCKIVSANTLFLVTFGYELSEIANNNLSILIPEEDIGEFTQIWKNIQKGRIYHGVHKYKDKMGKIIWLDLDFTPVKEQEEQVVKILLLAMDITDKKILEDNFEAKSKKIKELEDEIKLSEQKINTLQLQQSELLEQKQAEVKENKLFEDDSDKLYINWLKKISG